MLAVDLISCACLSLLFGSNAFPLISAVHFTCPDHLMLIVQEKDISQELESWFL